MKKLSLTAMAIVLSLALGAPAVADTLKAPTPVKPAQPATNPVTTVPTPPAAKTPATPTTPVIGKKPVTGPAGRIGLTKALVPTLRVNNNAGPVTVARNGTATVTWDLSGAPNASGIHLLVHTASLESVNCAALPATASPDSGKYTTSPRALTLTNAYYRNEFYVPYFIKGCLFNRTTDLGQVTDTYTGDWTNQVVLRVDSRPDLVVTDAVVFVVEPLYKVGPNWFENMGAITSFPPLFMPDRGYSATIENRGASGAKAWFAILNLSDKTYSSGVQGSLLPGGHAGVRFPTVPLDNLWADYQQGRLSRISGLVYIEEGGFAKSTRVVVGTFSPTNLRATRTGTGFQLSWAPGSYGRVDEYHIVARFNVIPTGQPVNPLIPNPGRPVYRRFSVGGNMNTISSSSHRMRLPPWSDMVDNRACFRVVALSRQQSFPGLEVISAPSNEVCFAVRDRRN